MHAPPGPAPTPGEMAAPGRPGPENFQECPTPPHPENAPGFNCYPAPPRAFSPCPAPHRPEMFFLRPAPPQKKAAPCIPD